MCKTCPTETEFHLIWLLSEEQSWIAGCGTIFGLSIRPKKRKLPAISTMWKMFHYYSIHIYFIARIFVNYIFDERKERQLWRDVTLYLLSQ